MVISNSTMTSDKTVLLGIPHSPLDVDLESVIRSAGAAFGAGSLNTTRLKATFKPDLSNVTSR